MCCLFCRLFNKPSSEIKAAGSVIIIDYLVYVTEVGVIWQNKIQINACSHPLTLSEY